MGKRGKAGKEKWIVSEWLEDDDRRERILYTVVIVVLVAALLWRG